VDFGVAIGAKRYGVVDVIRPALIQRGDVMNLHLVKRAAKTAPATSIGQQLLDFVLLESHLNAPNLRPSVPAQPPRSVRSAEAG